MIFVLIYFLKLSIVQISQVDSHCNEKTYLSHMYNISVCNQHYMEQLDTNKVSSFGSFYSKYKLYFLIKTEITS